MLSIATGLIMLVGSYGTPDETNFRTYTFNTESGTIVPIDSIAGLSNPSFLAVADKGETVFAVNENDSYGDSELTMLRKDGADGHYVPVSRQMVIGKNPCHVAVAPNGEYVVTANYGSGSISVFKFKGADKLLEKPRVVKFSGQSVDSIRQSMPIPIAPLSLPTASLWLSPILAPTVSTSFHSITMEMWISPECLTCRLVPASDRAI